MPNPFKLFKIFGKGAKAGKGLDEIAALTAKLGDATKMLDDVGDLSKLDDLGDAGKYVNKLDDGNIVPNKNYAIQKADGSFVYTNSKKGVKWEKGMKIVPTKEFKASLKITDATKAARGKNLIKADSVWQPNAMRNLKAGAMFGVLGTMGYVFYRAIGIVGTFSDAAESNINNFFGMDCEENCEDDAACLEACHERGSRNMVLTGVAIIGVIGLLVMSKSGGKKEKSDESDD
jgi:hypothetical protein